MIPMHLQKEMAIASKDLDKGRVVQIKGLRFRELLVEDFLEYLDRFEYDSHPQVYKVFLDVMNKVSSQRIDKIPSVQQVSKFFISHPELIAGFKTFLPPECKIKEKGQGGCAALQKTSRMISAKNKPTLLVEPSLPMINQTKHIKRPTTTLVSSPLLQGKDSDETADSVKEYYQTILIMTCFLSLATLCVCFNLSDYLFGSTLHFGRLPVSSIFDFALVTTAYVGRETIMNRLLKFNELFAFMAIFLVSYAGVGCIIIAEMQTKTITLRAISAIFPSP